MTDRYETDLSSVECSGWLKWGALWVTAEPLRDADTGGYAHISYRRALEAATAFDARLPTRDDVIALFDASIVLRPVILPDDAMCRAAGWDGNPHTRELVAQPLRTAHMSGREWCDIHDARVRSQLDALSWDGSQPVANAGKHWIAPCPPGRGRICGWLMGKTLIQAGTDPNGQHDDLHHDYGTTCLLIREVMP